MNEGDPWVNGLRALVALAAAVALLTVVWVAGVVPGSALLRPWYLSRASGLVAYILLWFSVCVGLLQSMGYWKGLARAWAAVEVHDYISMVALYATVAHALILVFDQPDYALSLPAVLVPFAADRSPLPMALGIVALYLAIIASVTAYLRGRINPRWWRVIHLSSLVGFLLALLHSVFLGTDSAVATGLYATTAAIALGLTALRIYQATAGKRTGTPVIGRDARQG